MVPAIYDPKMWPIYQGFYQGPISTINGGKWYVDCDPVIKSNCDLSRKPGHNSLETQNDLWVPVSDAAWNDLPNAFYRIRLP